MNEHQSLSRRRFLSFAATAALGAVTAACGQTPPATQNAPAADAGATAVPAAPEAATAASAAAPAGDRISLSVWHVDEDELDPIIELFKEQHANVDVAYQFYPWGEFWDKLNTAYAAGTPPDVHRQDDDEIPFFVQRGVLLPVDEAVSAVAKPDELYWPILESTKIDGKLWIVAPATRVANLVYNKTLFEEAGVPLPPTTFPSEEWSWDAFAEAARKLTDPAKQQYGFAGADSLDFVISMGRSNGGDVISTDCMASTMHEPAMAEAFQKAADMILVDKSAVDPETATALGGGWEMFNQGKVAMIFAQTRDLPAEDVTFAWDVAGLPVFPGKEPSIFAAIECFGVPQTTKYPSQAMAFAAAMMSEPSQRIFAQTKNIIPVNKKAATEVWVPAAKYNRQLLLDAAPYGRTLPFAVGFGAVQDATWPIYGEIFRGQKTVADALAEAQPLADAELAKAGGCLGGA
jgi:multiple sugar transport system substrate-binding protein